MHLRVDDHAAGRGLPLSPTRRIPRRQRKASARPKRAIEETATRQHGVLALI
jgi:hypothetical protein